MSKVHDKDASLQRVQRLEGKQSDNYSIIWQLVQLSKDESTKTRTEPDWEGGVSKNLPEGSETLIELTYLQRQTCGRYVFLSAAEVMLGDMAGSRETLQAYVESGSTPLPESWSSALQIYKNHFVHWLKIIQSHGEDTAM